MMNGDDLCEHFFHEFLVHLAVGEQLERLLEVVVRDHTRNTNAVNSTAESYPC